MKVISGGQTGADIAALIAARELGLETGGFAPTGWLSENGAQEALLRSFGMIECDEPGYPRKSSRFETGKLWIQCRNGRVHGYDLCRNSRSSQGYPFCPPECSLHCGLDAHDRSPHLGNSGGRNSCGNAGRWRTTDVLIASDPINFAKLRGASLLCVGAYGPLVVEALREINRIPNTHRPLRNLIGPNLKIAESRAPIDGRERSIHRVLST